MIELECYAGESTRWKDVPCEDIVDFQGSRFVDVVNGLRVSFRSLKKDGGRIHAAECFKSQNGLRGGWKRQRLEKRDIETTKSLSDLF